MLRRLAFLSFILLIALGIMGFQVYRVFDWFLLGSIKDQFDVGLATVAVAFFVAVDVFLIRVIRNYFNNAGSAFISLRYLRKRPISFLGMIGVAAGVCALVLVNSVMTGFLVEYKQQIQGSLSDVIVRTAHDVHAPTPVEVDSEAWRIAHERVLSDPDRAKRWRHALALAIKNLKEERLTEDELLQIKDTDGLDFPYGLEPPPIGELSEQAKLLLESLNSPKGNLSLDFRHLPRHPRLEARATPVAIQLANSSKGKTQLDIDIRDFKREVESSIYQPRVEAGNAFVARAARRHGDDAVTSPRISTHSPIRVGEGRIHPTAVNAVDPVGEPKISIVGDFMRDAERRDFQLRYHVEPLIRVLNFTLLFEVPVASDDLSSYTPVVYTPDGKLEVNYNPRINYLMYRRGVDSDGTLDWGVIDAIKYRKGTPGNDLRKLVVRSLKRLESAQEGADLKRELQSVTGGLREVANYVLDGKRDSIRSERATVFDAEYPGDDVCMLFLEDAMLLGYPIDIRRALFEADRWLSQLKAAVEKDRADAGEDEVKEVPDHLKATLSAIESHLSKQALEPISHADGAEALQSASEELASSVSEISTKLLREHGRDLRRQWGYTCEVLDLQRKSQVKELFGARSRLSTLEEHLTRWDRTWKIYSERMDAYSQILPLRTIKLIEETVDEYLLRASTMPPYITEKGWQKRDPEFVAAMRSAFAKRMREGFIPLRLTRKKTHEAILTKDLPASYRSLANEMKATIDSALRNEDGIAGAKSLPMLSRSISNLRYKLNRIYLDYLDQTELAPSERIAVTSVLAPLSSDAYEYWLITPEKPAFIVGDALALRLNLVPRVNLRGDVARDGRIRTEVEGVVFRQASQAQNVQDFGKGPLAGSSVFEMDFSVNAVYRSGLFDDNLHTLYGDYHGWIGLLGAGYAEYSNGVKIHNYEEYDGQPARLQYEFEEYLKAEAATLASDDSAHADVREAAARATSRRGAMRVTIWEQEREKMLQAVELERTLITVLIALVVMLSGVLILIVVYLTVVEKVRDIGIINALGASPWGIRSVFSFNALFIGVFGAVVGGALSILICENLRAIEDFIYESFGLKIFPPDIYYLTYLPAVRGGKLWILCLNFALPAIMWSFMCGFLPAWLASRKSTVEALHYE